MYSKKRLPSLKSCKEGSKRLRSFNLNLYHHMNRWMVVCNTSCVHFLNTPRNWLMAQKIQLYVTSNQIPFDSHAHSSNTPENIHEIVKNRTLVHICYLFAFHNLHKFKQIGCFPGRHIHHKNDLLACDATLTAVQCSILLVTHVCVYTKIWMRVGAFFTKEKIEATVVYYVARSLCVSPSYLQ